MNINENKEDPKTKGGKPPKIQLPNGQIVEQEVDPRE